MTIVDKLIPYYSRFLMGFSTLAIAIGIVQFCMNFVTLLTVKGIYFPAEGIVLLGAMLIGGCVFLGWFWEHFDIQDRINKHTITKTNPVLRDIQENQKEVLRLLHEKRQ